MKIEKKLSQINLFNSFGRQIFIPFIRLVLIALVILSAVASNANCLRTEEEREIKGGGGIIWPLDESLVFPWKNLQGVWQTINTDRCDTNFIFQVKNNSEGKFLVTVYQIDPYQCRPIATGSGVTDDRVLTALMKEKGGVVYNLSVRVFKTSGKNVVVMTTAPSTHPELNRSFVIKKVSAKPELMCY